MRVWVYAALSLAPAIAQNINFVAGNSTWRDVFNGTIDSAGNIYAADFGKHVVYKVDKLGGSTVIAGTSGSAGYAGDGALATTAKLNQPSSVAVGADGSVYIAEYSGE